MRRGGSRWVILGILFRVVMERYAVADLMKDFATITTPSTMKPWTSECYLITRYVAIEQ